jgi:hypothetical protein
MKQTGQQENLLFKTFAFARKKMTVVNRALLCGNQTTGAEQQWPERRENQALQQTLTAIQADRLYTDYVDQTCAKEVAA